MTTAEIVTGGDEKPLDFSGRMADTMGMNTQEMTSRPKLVTIENAPIAQMNGTHRLSTNELRSLLKANEVAGWGATVTFIDQADAPSEYVDLEEAVNPTPRKES